jgi:hypothetical protein
MNISKISDFFIPQDSKSLAAYFLAITISCLFAFLLQLTYRLYFKDRETGIDIGKSFALIAPAVTGIFLVIQFSLPLSLGLLGALSFVRFRTPIKEPEEIGFLLVVIATSLTCAVFRFDVGFLILSVIFFIAFLRGGLHNYWSPRRRKTADIFISTDEVESQGPDISVEITSIFSLLQLKYTVMGISSAEGVTSHHLRAHTALSARHISEMGLKAELLKLPSIKSVDIVFRAGG